MIGQHCTHSCREARLLLLSLTLLSAAVSSTGAQTIVREHSGGVANDRMGQAIRPIGDLDADGCPLHDQLSGHGAGAE